MADDVQPDFFKASDSYGLQEGDEIVIRREDGQGPSACAACMFVG